jgi:hypothetical protein
MASTAAVRGVLDHYLATSLLHVSLPVLLPGGVGVGVGGVGGVGGAGLAAMCSGLAAVWLLGFGGLIAARLITLVYRIRSNPGPLWKSKRGGYLLS